MENRKQCFLLACACLSFDVRAGPSLSEGDYFTDFPVVLSVSRLSQPLSDAPGAVTIIDREMIRRTGAREVADLLRLVPGFIVAHAQGSARPKLPCRLGCDYPPLAGIHRRAFGLFHPAAWLRQPWHDGCRA